MINPVAQMCWAVLSCLTRALAARNEIGWSWDGQEQPWVNLGGGQDLPLPLPDSWGPGECREGFLFGNPPCRIFTVSMSRDFSSMDVS